MGIFSEDVDEIISICGETGNDGIDVLIDGVYFFGDFTLFEEKGCLMFFGDEDNSLGGDDSNG